jgi:hypothetical protein
VTKPTAVTIEVGTKKVFASAVDWPGWCRAGRTEELALAALDAYAQRYAEVADRAGVRFPRSASAAFEVVERVTGSATTDFGVPGQVTGGDAEPLTAARGTRRATLVGAAWQVFDRIAAETPAELRKGPRGGGRDRDKMIDHVLTAEAAYARKIGVRHRPPALRDTAAIKALRDDILAVLSRAGDGTPLVPKGWPPRYAARRIAWHVLDHAWEMQDRTER